jgi:hypothetical protein
VGVSLVLPHRPEGRLRRREGSRDPPLGDLGAQRDRLRRDILAAANDLGARRLTWDGQRLTISARGALTIREMK